MGKLHVPKLGARKQIPLKAIEDAVRAIVKGFDPERVILFGSYADGQPRPESDVDLLVIMDTPMNETEQAVLICQNIEYHFGLDLLVRTPASLKHRLDLGDPFLFEVVQRGKVMYERARS